MRGLTTVEMIGDLHVRITRGDGTEVVLSNAEVCMAASIMREEMLRCMPEEIPEPAAPRAYRVQDGPLSRCRYGQSCLGEDCPGC